MSVFDEGYSAGYDKGYEAGRAYQREVDAELIGYMYGNGKDMAKAIREQKIDD